MHSITATCQLVSTPPPGVNRWYGGNRSPLLPASLIKLPLGSVRPQGWLRHQLDLMVDGMTGRLGEVSKYLAAGNGWFGTDGEAWEEQPYWLRGYYPLAVLTGDARCRAEANRWLEAVLTSSDADGYFGAPCNKRVKGKTTDAADLWPHMIMLDAVIQHYEATGDARALPLMSRFFAFCRDLPDTLFMPDFGNPGQGWDAWAARLIDNFGTWLPHIQYVRAGDMLPHIYWLYNRTGDAWLLPLADRFYAKNPPPESEWLEHHVVNFTQRFRYPGTYYAQSGEAWHKASVEYWYNQHMATWGQQPRGIFAADEQVRPGKTDPRQGAETCAMVEFARSFYLLGQFTGDPIYADRCEDVMLNHFPAAQTPDLKGLRYVTASNMPQSDASSHHDFTNEQKGWGNHLVYSPHKYRCCQHNVAMGWPWYAQHLWQATADNGLALWMFAACEVTARAGADSQVVNLQVETGYPFSGDVRVSVTSESTVAFPLYLRIPGWCRQMRVSINGEPLPAETAPRHYLRIDRLWQSGDVLEISLAMEIGLTEWPRTGSVTVDRGPLSYSVGIGETWRQCGGSEAWPEWEVLPATPWNYGLVIDRKNPAASLEVTERAPSPGQPWRPEAAPVTIRVKARRIPNWMLVNETVEPLQLSPIRSSAPKEAITLIPLGCAHLRMACLPIIGNGADAHNWLPPTGDENHPAIADGKPWVRD